MKRRIRLARWACAGVLTSCCVLPYAGQPAVALEPDVPCVVGIPAQMREAGPGKPADHAGSTSAARPTGRGVKVAVIDTGVSDHPRLGGVEPIADFVTPQDADPLTDCDGHGTAVAGAIAARDTGDGLSGIAPDAQVLSLSLIHI